MRALRVFLLLLLSATFCGAQKESLTIGPGDTIHISVLETSDLDQHVRVTDAGTVPLILGGSVRVAELSPADAAAVVAKALVNGNFLNHPHVSVTIESSATRHVSVIGQVHSPGSFDIGTPRSILDVLALSGGLTDTAGRKITISRRDTKEQIEYFISNNSAVALKDQPLVYPGDTVFVPKAYVVFLLGDVARPGGYAVSSTNAAQITVLQAVALAGGTPPNAVPSHARLIRKKQDGSYVEMPLPLSAMQKGKQADFVLEEDDIIYVPFSYLRNMALGVDSLVAAAASASIYRF